MRLNRQGPRDSGDAWSVVNASPSLSTQVLQPTDVPQQVLLSDFYT
jgi:hypothetical protein